MPRQTPKYLNWLVDPEEQEAADAGIYDFSQSPVVDLSAPSIIEKPEDVVKRLGIRTEQELRTMRDAQRAGREQQRQQFTGANLIGQLLGAAANPYAASSGFSSVAPGLNAVTGLEKKQALESQQDEADYDQGIRTYYSTLLSANRDYTQGKLLEQRDKTLEKLKGPYEFGNQFTAEDGTVMISRRHRQTGQIDAVPLLDDKGKPVRGQKQKVGGEGIGYLNLLQRMKEFEIEQGEKAAKATKEKEESGRKRMGELEDEFRREKDRYTEETSKLKLAAATQPYSRATYDQMGAEAEKRHLASMLDLYRRMQAAQSEYGFNVTDIDPSIQMRAKDLGISVPKKPEPRPSKDELEGATKTYKEQDPKRKK